MRIKIIENINSEFAVSPEDGDKIHNIISEHIAMNEVVIIDFQDIDIVTTAFLNNAIGKLYNEFKPEQLNTYVKLENITESDLFLLKKVIDRAKITFSSGQENNPLGKVIEEEFGNE